MAILHPIINPVFVFHIDVVLLSLFALYVALTLPRALVRLFQPSELLNGFFLRSGTAAPLTTPTLHRSDTRGRSGANRTKPLRSTSTRTNQTGRTLVDLPEDAVAGEGGKSSRAQRPALIIPRAAAAATATRGSRSRRPPPPPRRAPTRVPRWTTILHPTLAYALNFRVAPGFSFGKLLVLLAYAALMLFASLRRSDPFSDPVRTGYVAMSQIPIAVALAGKTNWLSWACGVGYEKVCSSSTLEIPLCSKTSMAVKLHTPLFGACHRRHGQCPCPRLLCVPIEWPVRYAYPCWIVYMWSLNGTMRKQLSVPKTTWGVVALGAIDLLFVCSLSFIRNRMYTLFFTVHVTGVTLFLLAVRHFSVFHFSSVLTNSQTYKHAHSSLPYVLAAVGLYVFDHLARIARTRYTTGWLAAERALNGGTTLVHVPYLRAGWRAGQHVRVRVVSNAWFGWWATWLICRARPFTIAAGSDSGGMMLPIKALGSWTRNLLRMAGDADDARPEPKPTDVEYGRGPAREVRVIIEGPYSEY